MIDTAAELELKRAAARIYKWLSWLPLISLPWFLSLVWRLNPAMLTGEVVGAAALPATPYLLVLFLTASNAKHVFVKRHAQQGFALVILRTMSAAFTLILGTASWSFAIVFFIFVNGGLWFFGRSTGLAQVNEGVGMFVKQAERLSLRPIKELERQLKAPEDRGGSPDGRKDHDRTDQAPAQIAAQSFARGEALITAGRSRDAVEVYLEAFRMGDPAVRDLAIRQLEAFGELEEF